MAHSPLNTLTFALGGEVFAIDASAVREILDVGVITRVPNAPAFVGGLINVRGRVVPLADPRLKFGMEAAPPTLDTRIVVIEVDLDGEPTIVGMLADKVHEVTEVTVAQQEDAPRIGMRWRPEYIRCIAKRGGDFVIVLEIDHVFASTAPPEQMGGDHERFAPSLSA